MGQDGVAAAIVTVVIHPSGAPEPMRAECRRRVRASRRVRVREIDDAPHPPAAGRQSAAGSPPAANPRSAAGPRSAARPPPGECRLELPGYAGLVRQSLARLCAHARAHPAGPVHVLLPGATGPAEAVRLWCGESDPAGPPRWEAASRFGIVDLRQLAAPPPRLERVGRWARGWLPESAYGWLAARVKQLRRRVRDRLFRD